MTPAEMHPVNDPARAHDQAAPESDRPREGSGALNAAEGAPARRAAASAPPARESMIGALLMLIASVLGMVLLGLTGFQRFQRSQREEQTTLQAQQAMAPRLYYGLRLPDLEVQVSRVRPATLRLSSFRGKWLALVLVSGDCDACARELRSLASIYPQYQRQLAILLVLLAGPDTVPGVLQWTAHSIERRFRLPFSVGIDTTGRLLGLADRPLIMPFCVLIDPDGFVRYSAVGSDPSHSTTQFATLLRARLDGVATVQTLRWHEPVEGDTAKAPVAPDGPIILPAQRSPTALSSLFSPEITVITFLRGKPVLTRERLFSLAHLAQVPSNIRMIFLYADAPGASPPRGLPPAAIVGRAGEELFRRYEVSAGPRSFVIARKHLLIGEGNVSQSSYAVRAALDQYFLLHG